MLTKRDLEEIKYVVNGVVEERLRPINEDVGKVKEYVGKIDTIIDAKLIPIKEDIKGIDSVIDAKLKPIKKDLRYLRKTVGIIVKNYDEGDVKLERRVNKIEKHLGLPQEN